MDTTTLSGSTIDSVCLSSKRVRIWLNWNWINIIHSHHKFHPFLAQIKNLWKLLLRFLIEISCVFPHLMEAIFGTRGWKLINFSNWMTTQYINEQGYCSFQWRKKLLHANLGCKFCMMRLIDLMMTPLMISWLNWVA